MSKKIILLTLGIGTLGFVGMFALAWFTRPKPQVTQTVQADTAGQGQAAPQSKGDELSAAAERIAAIAGPTKQTMTDQELHTLIFEVREKIKEYNLKLQNLDVQEKRLQDAKTDLKKDLDKMANLRVELASTVASLKDERDKLLQSKLEIEKSEQKNLISIAAAYDKMDAESAGKILMDMVTNQSSKNSSDDAVKILYYMEERTKAKVLASIAEVKPAISVYICQRLKRIVTKD